MKGGFWIAALVAAPSLGAQQPDSAVACDGRPISSIVIRTESPSLGGLAARLPLVTTFVGRAHVTTAPDVVRAFLQIKEGKPCDELARQETERILRAQTFIAEARVRAYPAGADSLRVEIVTVDEASLILTASARDKSPYLTGLSFGNGNLRGEGVTAYAGWSDGGAFRDDFVARYTNYVLRNVPMRLQVGGERRQLGSEWSADLSMPFYSDLRRVSWRAAVGEDHDVVRFPRPNADPTSLGVKRSFASLGALARVGRPGLLALAGASLSAERARADLTPRLITRDGPFPDTTRALIGQFGTNEVVRASLLLGARWINFLRVTGFDALYGEQDIRRGLQIGTVLGRGIKSLGRQGDLLVAGDFYGGVGTSISFIGVQFGGEMRREDGDTRWRDVLASGRLGLYVKPSPRTTWESSTEWSHGRNLNAPFTLSLGDRSVGMRGYESARGGGGERLISRLEYRRRAGTVSGAAGVGIAWFVEAGKIWAGDSPLGVTTPLLASAGVGLLAAFPIRSQRLWRIDVAYPATATRGAHWELRLTNTNRAQQFWLEPFDIRRNRERSVPTGLFNWP